MLFLLAREMGHCRAGHALWKTVIRFFLGEQGPGKGMMAGGIFNAILSPTALIESAIEAPLLGGRGRRKSRLTAQDCWSSAKKKSLAASCFRGRSSLHFFTSRSISKRGSNSSGG
jgi:hypothetical protein